MFKFIPIGWYGVYVLMKEESPIYVGYTSNIEKRLKSHKSNKDFDDYIVLKSYKTKKEALIAEYAILSFLTLFGGKDILNSKIKFFRHSSKLFNNGR